MKIRVVSYATYPANFRRAAEHNSVAFSQGWRGFHLRLPASSLLDVFSLHLPFIIFSTKS